MYVAIHFFIYYPSFLNYKSDRSVENIYLNSNNKNIMIDKKDFVNKEKCLILILRSLANSILLYFAGAVFFYSKSMGVRVLITSRHNENRLSLQAIDTWVLFCGHFTTAVYRATEPGYLTTLVKMKIYNPITKVQTKQKFNLSN